MNAPAPTKRFRRLARLLKQYGYSIKPLRSGHNGIFNEAGERIYTMSSSPKVVEYAEQNTVKDLKLGCVLPQEAKL